MCHVVYPEKAGRQSYYFHFLDGNTKAESHKSKWLGGTRARRFSFGSRVAPPVQTARSNFSEGENLLAPLRPALIWTAMA